MDLKSLPEINFVTETIEEILETNIAAYEKAYLDQRGEAITLYPGDPMRIHIYTISAREYQLKYLINEIAKQNMLRYAKGDVLEHLGALFNVEKTSEKKALSDVKITLSKTFETDYIIPSGTRSTPGNQIYFATDQEYIILPGQTEITIPVLCTVGGSIGNNFVPGQINSLVDSLPFVESVSNTITSYGGAEIEGEESFRENIRLAPSTYSTAGPDDAYEARAKTYSTNVADAYAHSPTPGVVEVAVAMTSGIPTAEEIVAIQAHVADKYKRPMTDNVQVITPTVKAYDINVQYFISKENELVETVTKTKVVAAVEEYKLWQRSALSLHINPSMLHNLMMKAGASRIVITTPVHTTLLKNELAIVNLSTVNYGGLEDDQSV